MPICKTPEKMVRRGSSNGTQVKQPTLKRAKKVKQSGPPWSVQLVQEDYEEPEDSRCYANFDMSFFIASPGQEPPKGWNVIESVSVESKKDLDKFLHEIEKGDSPVEEFALWPKTFELCTVTYTHVCNTMFVWMYGSVYIYIYITYTKTKRYIPRP